MGPQYRRKNVPPRNGCRFAFMIRFGGSPYASQTPQTVVTVVQIMTANRMARLGAAASIRMMTSVRIVSPIIDTPSRMPEANATTAVTETTVGRIAPPLRRSRKNVMPSSIRVCAITDTKNVRPENEEHRVGVDQIVEPAERQQMLPRPAPPAGFGDLRVPLGRRQAAECRDDDQQHPVGQRVLVDLVFERAEDEQPEDGGKHFCGQQGDRKRRRPSHHRRAPATNAQPRTNFRPDSMTTADDI